ncbi:MAG: acyl-ACP--UDP-N-acetylglucosamine O-acyltransferase [Candidatus Neomarinimicrobiota bacterium]
MSTAIHPNAHVDTSARLGIDVKVGPFAVIGGDSEVGDNTEIMGHVQILAGTRFGSGCRVHHGAVVGGAPQDISYTGGGGGVAVGDGAVLREFVTVNRGTQQDGTIVGSKAYLMAYCHVGHDGVVGDEVILANGVQLGGFAQVGDYASIGGMTPVHQFCRVGTHAFVGGGYRVVKDVPPYILATGEPLGFAGLNVVGLRRRGFSAESRGQIKRAYRLIYRSGNNLSQALEAIRAEMGDVQPIQALLTFIEEAKRGII